MKYNIRGDKLVVTDAINNYAKSKLDRLNKYFKEDSDTSSTRDKISEFTFLIHRKTT